MPPNSSAPVDRSGTEPAVSLVGVRRCFGDVVAVDGLNFEVPSGTVTVLLGPNGAGKTTVVRLVTGALRPNAGTVRTLGLDPDRDDEGTEVRRRCGVVPARPALYDRLSGRDNLAYAAALFEVDPRDAERRIQEAAERFGIADALGQRVGGYSTGMRARLALARAVLHDPDLLLLDEPTAGLDPESARAVLGLIDEMAEGGKTVLMCTHLLLEAEGLADQVVVMDHGRAIVAGSPAELSRRYWPAARVLLDADDPSVLDLARDLPFVQAFERNGVVMVDLEHDTDVPDLVDALVRAGARLKRVEPCAPSLEELYFRIRKQER
ncbi:MAG: ABC transporter ATP-binding protein [Acidimicrobiia bacterium]